MILVSRWTLIIQKSTVIPPYPMVLFYLLWCIYPARVPKWPNMDIFGPFDLMPNQKTMRTSCLDGFSIMWVPKLLFTTVENRIFGPIYWHFLPISSRARPKTNANKVPRWVFRYVGNKVLISPIQIRIFCPKTTKFGPKLAFLFILGQALLAHLVPCCRLWRAGCISQDTYLLYLMLKRHIYLKLLGVFVAIYY